MLVYWYLVCILLTLCTLQTRFVTGWHLWLLLESTPRQVTETLYYHQLIVQMAELMIYLIVSLKQQKDHHRISEVNPHLPRGLDQVGPSRRQHPFFSPSFLKIAPLVWRKSNEESCPEQLCLLYSYFKFFNHFNCFGLKIIGLALFLMQLMMVSMIPTSFIAPFHHHSMQGMWTAS